MPALHIRNVPETTLSALRERARRRGHSMQQEVREILDGAAGEPLPADSPAPIDLVTVRTSSSSTWSREEIYGSTSR
jgi:plasmid stability protein